MTRFTNENSTKNGSGKYSNGVFAQVRLTAEEKKYFAEWLDAESPELDEMVTLLAQDNYRISGKWESDSDCFMMTLTKQDAKHTNADLIIVSRHKTIYQAYALGFFKVYVLYRDKRLPETPQTEDWG